MDVSPLQKSDFRGTYRPCSENHRNYKRIEASSRYKFSQARGSN